MKNLAQLNRPTVREIANLQKADKSILFQIVFGWKLEKRNDCRNIQLPKQEK